MRRTARALALVIGMLLPVASAGPAVAITNGEPDGGAHPQVGAIVGEFDDGLFQVCSGSLIAPTALLTAGHCTDFFERADLTIWVTFDEAFTAASTLHAVAEIHTHPDFTPSLAYDVGVLVLAAPVAADPVDLPGADMLAALSEKNGLKGQTFTSVGYGWEGRENGGGPPGFFGGDTRMVATGTYRALRPLHLLVSQNGSTGDGGTCFGDSGGPIFLGDSTLVVAITSVGDSVCRATNMTHRVDLAEVLEFLGAFLA